VTSLPTYASPFTEQQQVLDLEQRYLQGDTSVYSDEVALAAGNGIRARSELRKNLQTIFRWKLQTFLKRKWQWVVEFPSKDVSDSQIEAAVSTALASTDDPKTIIEAIRAFDDLPCVGIPVASAFLTMLYPCRFTVIDRQAYKALCAPFPNILRPREYLSYLEFCKGQASNLGVSLRSYDRALWQRGADLGRIRTLREPCSGDKV